MKMASILALAHTGYDSEVLAVAKPPDEAPYMQLMWHYARGLVLARQAKTADAETELKAVEELSSSGKLFKIAQNIVPAEILGDIAAEVLRARISQAKGDMKGAIASMREAAEDEAQVPYTEPAFWYYPVKQSLGGLLLASGNAKEASDVFRASLLDQPGNGWALYGLMKSYEKLGDKPAAKETQKLFKAAWLGKTQKIDLKRM
jgi:tetratricopeptide (TPR) repeat protein